MQKIIRVDKEEIEQVLQGKHTKRTEDRNGLALLLARWATQRFGDFRFPYLDQTAVRFELWEDDGKLYFRFYRPRPQAWPGRGLIDFTYPISSLEAKS